MFLQVALNGCVDSYSLPSNYSNLGIITMSAGLEAQLVVIFQGCEW